MLSKKTQSSPAHSYNAQAVTSTIVQVTLTIRCAFCALILNPRDTVSGAHWTGILRGPSTWRQVASLQRVPVRAAFLELNSDCFSAESEPI